MASSVRETDAGVVELSQCVPAINKAGGEVSLLWYGRHAKLRTALAARCLMLWDVP